MLSKSMLETKTSCNDIDKWSADRCDVSSGYSSCTYEDAENSRSYVEIIDLNFMMQNNKVVNEKPQTEPVTNSRKCKRLYKKADIDYVEDQITDYSSSEHYDSDTDPQWVPEKDVKYKMTFFKKQRGFKERLNNLSSDHITQYKPSKQKSKTSKFYFCMTEDHLKVVRLAMNYSNQPNNNKMTLWQFILFLLNHSVKDHLEFGIKWLDEDNRVFGVSNSKMLAACWGVHQKNSNMTFESMSRNLRYYYQKNIMKKHGVRLHYQFSESACQWYKKNLMNII